SDINILGERDYSIRAWLDPQELASRNMTAVDVANAVRSQNIEAALGQVGQAPMRRSQAFHLPIDTPGRLRAPAQFAAIMVRARHSRPATAAGGGGPSQGGGLPSSGITDPLLAAASLAGIASGTTTVSGSTNSGTTSSQSPATGTTSSGTVTTSPA